LIITRRPPLSTLFPYTTLFRSKLFLQLIEEAHSRGIKIIIDGVFNHTGVQFWAFQDIIKNGKKSKYKDWYIINSFDDITTIENRSEEHTSELQSRENLVCRLLL